MKEHKMEIESKFKHISTILEVRKSLLLPKEETEWFYFILTFFLQFIKGNTNHEIDQRKIRETSVRKNKIYVW